MPRPTRAIEARRLKFTPELIANVRRRWEHSDESTSSMAADLGCCKTTLYGIARREGWVRYQKPPRDLLPAARVLERAERLAQSVAAGEPPPERGRSPSEARRVGVNASAEVTPSLTLPLSGGGDGKAAPIGEGEASALPVPTPEQVRADIAKLYADVVQVSAEFKTFRDGLKGRPHGLLEREQVARTLAGLSLTYRRLQMMLAGAPAASIQDTGTAYDDMPADLDAFRRNLARRIEAFFASRPDAGDGGGVAAERTTDAGA